MSSKPYDSSDLHPIAVTFLFRTQAERESFMRQLEDAPLSTLHWRHLAANPHDDLEAATLIAVEVCEDKLAALVDKARQRRMTPEEIEEQRVSFAYGVVNGGSDRVAREDVVRASRELHEHDQDVKTTHALAAELLAGPDVPVQIAVKCKVDDENYNFVCGDVGTYERTAFEDKVMLFGVDSDLFEYCDGEVADHIHAERKTP